MPEHLLRKGDPCLLRSYQERAEGVPAMIPEAKRLGIVSATGHSGASYEQSMETIEWGAAAVTHTVNAIALLHQHRPAILGATPAPQHRPASAQSQGAEPGGCHH